jgi:hypothetical protein
MSINLNSIVWLEAAAVHSCRPCQRRGCGPVLDLHATCNTSGVLPPIEKGSKRIHQGGPELTAPSLTHVPPHPHPAALSRLQPKYPAHPSPLSASAIPPSIPIPMPRPGPKSEPNEAVLHAQRSHRIPEPISGRGSNVIASYSCPSKLAVSARRRAEGDGSASNIGVVVGRERRPAGLRVRQAVV